MRGAFHGLVVWLRRLRRGSGAPQAKAGRAVIQEDGLFKLLFNNMSQGVCLFDGQQRLVVANPRYAEIYGLTPSDITPGMTSAEVMRARDAVGTCPTTSTEVYHEWRQAAALRDAPTHSTFELATGQIILIHVRPMPDGGWLATHEDVTERRRAELRVAHMARHDTLTDLPNRMQFREYLSRNTASAHQDSSIAVLCLDLDHFKNVNDSFGHPVGDALLCAAADRLRACIREGDLVARLGGDEFAIVQVGAEQPAQAIAVAERVIETIGKPFEIGGRAISVGTSVGIAVGRTMLDDWDTLLKNADLALYRAKGEGRGRTFVFSTELHERVQRRRGLEQDLRTALACDQLELHFQPLFNAQSETLCCFEALIRWRHPTRGLVSPVDFIPIAEEVGLVESIGEWVLRTACREATCWPSQVRVAVNLSAVQFRHGDLVAMVRAALADTGLSAERLELEITESVLLRDSEATLRTLHTLRAMGVRIALDDFGTGYSSLSYLRSFPFDKIKIDRSFTCDVNETMEALAIFRAVTYLGRTLRIDVTAEGVETREQLHRLRIEGCTEVQGFLFGSPRRTHELGELLLACAAGAPFATDSLAAA